MALSPADEAALEAYLDGGLTTAQRESLEERLRASQAHRRALAVLQQVRAAAQQAPRRDPPAGLTSAILSRVFAPEPVSGHPAWVPLASAAMLLIGLAAGKLVWDRPSAGVVPVAFALQAPRAEQVALVGDFTDWQPLPLSRRDGRWQATLPLPAGARFQYGFILNGRLLVIDPRAPALVTDAAGRTYAVLETGEGLHPRKEITS